MKISRDFLDMLLVATRDCDAPYTIRCYRCGEDIKADAGDGARGGDADRLMAALRACVSHVHGSDRCAPGDLDPSPAASLSERGKRRREDAGLAARIAARIGIEDETATDTALQIADGDLREEALMLSNWRLPKSAPHTAKGQQEMKRSLNRLWSSLDAIRSGIAKARRDAREADARAEVHAGLEARRVGLASPHVRAALAEFADALDPERARSAGLPSAPRGGEAASAASAREACAGAVREAWARCEGGAGG